MARTRDTRERIIESARDLYLRTGVSGLSMRKVAQAAGISATAIYRHFESKATLMLAVLEEGFELFASYLWRGLQGSDARERLQLTGTGYMHFALEQRAYYRVMFMSPAEDIGLAAMSERNQIRISPTFQFLVDRVRECIDNQVLMDAEAEELAAMIWANCHGLVALYLAGHFGRSITDEEQFEGFYLRATERFLRGLGP